MRAIVEHTHADAHAIARVLRSYGEQTILREPDELDGCLPPHDGYYADPWTAEIAPRIRASRRSGVTTSSIGDLLLRESSVPVIGVTGTAGKTGTAALVCELLRASGVPVIASSTARAGNLWPSHDVLAALADARPPAVVCVELTSTHLCYMACSPQIAVVTNLWADHVELHGSLRRYRAAKRVILAHQKRGDWAVLNADDRGSASLRSSVVGRCLWASGRRPVRRGVGVEAGRLVARLHGRRDDLGAAPTGLLASTIACACAAALVAGADHEHVRRCWPGGLDLPFRRTVLGAVGGALVIDDGMAATPAKAAAGLRELDPRETVAIVGGHRRLGGSLVHASAPELEQLGAFCALLATLRRVVAFGDAGVELARRLPNATLVPDLAAAWATARDEAAPGVTISLAPGFPLTLDERRAFAVYVSSGAIEATE